MLVDDSEIRSCRGGRYSIGGEGVWFVRETATPTFRRKALQGQGGGGNCLEIKEVDEAMVEFKQNLRYVWWRGAKMTPCVQNCKGGNRFVAMTTSKHSLIAIASSVLTLE